MKDNNPLFSVIVPVYNAEKYLSRCIDSILNQTYQNFELLLVDDGSKDKSGSICDKYGKTDSRVIVIHQSNSGPGTARNNGLHNAKGRYIIFVDSDDYLDSTYFEVVAENINEYDLLSFIIRKSKFSPNPKRSVRFSSVHSKRNVQKRTCAQHKQ